MTFASKAFNFYKYLESPSDLPAGVEAMNPYKDKKTSSLVAKFLDKYYDDVNKRILVLGINPGRFGGGHTGVNFTDGFALENYCGINNSLNKRRELSSVFIYKFIEKWGGAENFYKDYFLSAVSPLGFLKNGLNYNYYDDAEIFSTVKGFIIESLNKQISLGLDKKAVVILGTGKNMKFFNMLNREFGFFENVFALEHPRFIMQYRRNSLNEYIDEYVKTFKKVLQL